MAKLRDSLGSLVQDGMNVRRMGEVMAAPRASGAPEQLEPDEAEPREVLSWPVSREI